MNEVIVYIKTNIFCSGNQSSKLLIIPKIQDVPLLVKVRFLLTLNNDNVVSPKILLYETWLNHRKCWKWFSFVPIQHWNGNSIIINVVQKVDNVVVSQYHVLSAKWVNYNGLPAFCVISSHFTLNKVSLLKISLRCL